MKLTVEKSVHGQPSLQFHDLAPWKQERIRGAMRDKFMDSPYYKACSKASAFLQGDDHMGWMLIEFWNNNYQDFVNLLEARLNEPLGDDDFPERREMDQDEIDWLIEAEARIKPQDDYFCPHCRVSLRGEEIPKDARYHYGSTHWGREIAAIDRPGDRCTHFECPDCGGQWDRDWKKL